MKQKKNVTQAAVDGDVYSEIADVMTTMGYKMNHCTARNVVLRVMEKILTELVHSGLCDELSDERIKEVAASPDFQEAVVAVVEKIEEVRKRESLTQ